MEYYISEWHFTLHAYNVTLQKVKTKTSKFCSLFFSVQSVRPMHIWVLIWQRDQQVSTCSNQITYYHMHCILFNHTKKSYFEFLLYFHPSSTIYTAGVVPLVAFVGFSPQNLCQLHYSFTRQTSRCERYIERYTFHHEVESENQIHWIYIRFDE